MLTRSIWIGFDPREADAFAVARTSIRTMTPGPIPINGIVLRDLQERGLYWRETQRRAGQLWDVISDAPMSTEFAISRFLVPHLAKTGWALFMDCDMLVRSNLSILFDEIADPKYAVMCVKHHHVPDNLEKMDRQLQTRYARKNWSSVMLFNCDHPANEALTPELVNTLPGRDLHAFSWLDDELIGELHPAWNYLVGHTETDQPPHIVHHTDGTPSMQGYQDVEYSGEWWDALRRWAR